MGDEKSKGFLSLTLICEGVSPFFSGLFVDVASPVTTFLLRENLSIPCSYFEFCLCKKQGEITPLQMQEMVFACQEEYLSVDGLFS